MPSHDKLSPVRVDPGMYRQLRQEAERHHVTITDEVARRLAASFERDRGVAADPKLAELRRRIGELADVIQSWGVGADWHSNPFAFEAMKAGMLALLEAAGRPPGGVVPPAGSMLVAGDNPETLGRTLARVVIERAGALARGHAHEFDFRTK